MSVFKPRPAAEAPAAITEDLLRWYDRNRRTLPWRVLPDEAPDPYRVWLSEVMLQQTTVAAVIPYFLRFLALWPSVHALADAPREEVMREWAGLGYYARARNLHDCAKAIVHGFGGTFPSTEPELKSLPGIGDYTGAAIAAIAFGRAATVVDGNVERVVSRLFAIEAPLPGSRPLIRERAARLVPAARAGDFAQATMDFGATLCTPKSPACGICPVRPLCLAQARGLERELPRRTRPPTRPQRFGATAVVRRPDGAILIRIRPEHGLLGGMAEYFGTPWAEGPPSAAALAEVADIALALKGTVDHVFTHFALRLDVYCGTSTGEQTPSGYRWVADAAVGREPMSSLMLKVREVADAAQASALVPLDLDGLGLVGLERADQENGGKGKDRQA